MEILVLEGNIAEVREHNRRLTGRTPGEAYADVLQKLDPLVRCEILCPADRDDVGLDHLARYRGVVITGSALNAYQDIPPVQRQVKLALQIFESGLPFFGSCWGLQVAVVAAGGEVIRNERGREVGYSRAVQLTEAGRGHPMHVGRPQVFDTPAVHSDHVSRLPENAVVTAFNEVSEVQALEIRHGNGVFWGVQYHPEFSLRDIAATLRRYGPRLIKEEGSFQTVDELETYARNLEILEDMPDRKDIAWQYALGADLLDPSRRQVEIRNWLDHCRREALRNAA
ncbi:type 1 glutamine amidotransferase [Paracoccus versutus]|uniref:GMP synthase (Glutamine-hydrolysing) n=1 Tax=Paracoccus versutus TaxID=34007 RepID=A0A3D9XUN5_PARVE|nr:type 1 glutamine amidotransferase [Paracoccus versutus]REF73431.1 GMP synthase (glutamine-hydrolysing) [Paracoccus versutus]WGR54552.1 type 1 glutamine amidotransferase [Paracoccus versutus]